MTRLRRLANVLGGLAMLALCAVILLAPDYGPLITAAIMSITLAAYGIRTLWLYATMARYMVGGKTLLYVSFVALDLGSFVVALLSTSTVILTLYLAAGYLFGGILDILRGLEARKLDSPYGIRLAHGALLVLVAAACILFANQPGMLLVFYCIGLGSSALVRIANALRPTDILYIP